MLKITAIGNLTNDVELKCHEDGKPYAILRCQRQCNFVVFRRTENVEKWRVKVYSHCIIILAVFVRQA